GAALDHAGAAAGPVGVAVAPDPAVLGAHEGVGEGLEDLGGAEPDVGVGSGGEAGAEMVGVAGAQGAVHAVGGHHQVGVGQPVGRDLAAEGEVDAETAGAVGEQVEQPVASDAVPLVAPVPGGQVPLLVGDVGDALPPVHGVGLHGAGRLRVVCAQALQQGPPVGHAPAVGGALRASFVDGDVVGGVVEFQQDGEIQTGGPAADADDLHAHLWGTLECRENRT